MCQRILKKEMGLLLPPPFPANYTCEGENLEKFKQEKVGK